MIAGTWWLILPVAFVATTMHALPWLSRRERLFGVTVTEEFRGLEGRRLVRQYELWLLPWTVAALGGSLLLTVVTHPFWGTALVLLPAFAACVLVWRTFNRIPRTASGGESVRIADLSANGGVNWIVALLVVPLGALVATAVYLHAHWAEIPARYPVHWNLQGVPNGWSTRTMMGVYGPLAVGGALVLFIGMLAALVRWGARQSAWRPALVAILVAAGWMVGGSFAMAGLLPLHYLPPGQIFGFEGAGLTVLAIATIIAMRRMRRPNTPHAEATPDACWHGGMFYYNPQDPALLVEKRIGLGWTFNFANPLAWVILALIILVLVGFHWWL
ncbi:MAG: DUF5808 domain-containing protein [Acidobacteriaceae bacterium]